MADPVTGSLLVFNGEIYNAPRLRPDLERKGHNFSGHSDTEVLLYGLAEYGPTFLHRLEGMYAFGYWDAPAGRLILARDPLGIKPLYLTSVEGGGWAFASEVRALRRAGLSTQGLDLAGLASYLAFGSCQNPHTLISGVRMLPAGHWLALAPGPAAPPPTRFWAPRDPDPTIDTAAAVARLRELLPVAVLDHLLSDVPVGVFLSSGLDSTILAGLAARADPGLTAVTVGFSDQPDMSEGDMAARTAARFGLAHRFVDVTGVEAVAAAEEWLGRLDLPSMDGLNVYLVSRATRRAGLKAALSGQGADELFGGYPSFRDVPRAQRLLRPAQLVPRRVRAALAWVAGVAAPAARRQKFRDMVASDSRLRSLYLHRRRTLSDAQLRALGQDPTAAGLAADFLPPDALTDWEPDEADPVAAIGRLETRLYLGNMLLRDSDTNGMAHSLEIRVPYLDQRLANFMLAVPGRVRLPTGGPSKPLLRAAFPELLPAEVAGQTKKGFHLPLKRWMRGPLRDRCEAALAAVRGCGAVEPAGVDAVWRQYLAEPESPIWSRAWSLVVLGAYLEAT